MRCGKRCHGNRFCFATKMPLFGNNFLQKRVSHRKLAVAQSLRSKSEDDDFLGSTVTLDLGDSKQTFENGRWSSQIEPATEMERENATLRKVIDQLEEENNLLKLKFELLLDMLAEESSAREE